MKLRAIPYRQAVGALTHFEPYLPSEAPSDRTALDVHPAGEWPPRPHVPLARAGAAPSIADVIDRYEARLTRAVRGKLRPELRRHLDEGDLLQEVYLIAYQKLGGLATTGRDDLLPWLARIAENKLCDKLDYLLACKRDVRRDVAIDAAPSEGGCPLPSAQQPSPYENAVASELVELRDRCLGELPPAYRDAIRLRDDEGASWEELRQRLGRPTIGAARELYRRAQGRLAERLTALIKPERACA